MREKARKNKSKYRLTIFDWQGFDEADTKTENFNDLKKAIRQAELVGLNIYQDVVVFDNQTDEEMYFRSGQD